MRKQQKTLKGTVEFSGKGLFTGQPVHMKFRPAAPNAGIVFIRTDLSDQPRIQADVDHAVTKLRRTAVREGDAEVEMIEHLMSAISGMEIDNLEIEISASEVAGADGSCKPYVDLFRSVGVVEQEEPRRVYAVREPIAISEQDSTLVALPSENGLEVSYTMNYEGTPLGSQHLSLKVNENSFADKISPARTFCLQSEAEAFLMQGLGKGADYTNTLVVGPNGVIDNQLRFPDEFVRHKILDMLGDLSLLNGALKAHVIGVRSGHAMNIKLVKKITETLQQRQGDEKKQETLLDVREIHKILPHRYPMLLIDKVIEMDGWKRIVGIKNVTFNEPFFQGHFPGRPIMPGVLQVEAMAQLAGVLLMRKAENAGKLAVLLSLDTVKLRRTVVPGDQLRIEAETLKMKSRTGEVFARATVDGHLTAEAVMKFMLVDPE